MNNTEKKAPPTAEQSLNYIAWHLKDMKEDLRLIVTNLAKMTQGTHAPSTQSTVETARRYAQERDKEKLPF